MRKAGALSLAGLELLDVFVPMEMFGLLADDFTLEFVAATAGPVASNQVQKALAENRSTTAPTKTSYLCPAVPEHVARLATHACWIESRTFRTLQNSPSASAPAARCWSNRAFWLIGTRQPTQPHSRGSSNRVSCRKGSTSTEDGRRAIPDLVRRVRRHGHGTWRNRPDARRGRV